MSSQFKRTALRPRKKVIRPRIQEWHLFCAGEGCDARLVKCYGGLDAEMPLVAADLEPGYAPGDDGIWRRTPEGQTKGLPRARAVRKALAQRDTIAEVRPSVIGTEGGREPPCGTPLHRLWKERELQKLLNDVEHLLGHKAPQAIEDMIQALIRNRRPSRPGAPIDETFLMECHECCGLAEITLCRHSVDQTQ